MSRGQVSSPKHPNAKFTAEQVRTIRAEAQGTQIRRLAWKYKVAAATIANLVARRSYREVE